MDGETNPKSLEILPRGDITYAAGRVDGFPIVRVFVSTAKVDAAPSPLLLRLRSRSVVD